MNLNQTIETIYSRYSVRLFNETPVSDELIYTILKAANAAPSAHNRQSW